MTRTVAIVGRPNVGKSTLFNLLTAGQGAVTGVGKAVTHATAGTTRDARLADAELFGLEFKLFDTAGVEEGKQAEGLQTQLNKLALKAAEQADILLFLLDGAAGLLPADRALAQRLRKMNKPVITLLNKADLKTAQSHAEDIGSLGFGAPILLSAAHNTGLDALQEALAEHIPFTLRPQQDDETPHLSRRQRRKQPQTAASATPAPQDNPSGTEGADENDNENNVIIKRGLKIPTLTRIAVLGRPNVGKSTLINTLLRDDVMLTGPVAGLTREAISHKFTYKNNEFTLIDTPGLRRKGKVEKDGLEFLSVGQSLQAAENADIIVLLVDASEHNVGKGKWQVIEQQDAQIAAMILSKFKPLVLGLTKWDLVEDPEACLEDVKIQLRHRLHDIHTPLAVPISSLKGKGIKTLLEAILKVRTGQVTTFSTGKLNTLLNKVLAKRSPPLANGKAVSLKFIRQTGVNPPSFTFWGNRISEVSGSYKQFLRHQLAEALSLEHNPVRIYFRANANPFHNKNKS